MKKRFLCLLLAFALFPSLAACQKSRTKQTATGFFFDTVVVMTIYWKDDSPLQAALEKCTYYENLFSKTVEGSDVWRINHAEGKRIQVDAETRAVIEKALEYSALSHGGFDITIEPCVALWNFTDPGKAKLPDPEALAAAAAKVDYTLVDVNDDGVKLGPGQTIDLGGIAKGYITGRIADLLKGLGVESGLLNFGGNVQAIGSKNDGTPWNVGIQDPRQPTGESIAVIPVNDGAVVTSGVYERGFDLDGVRYHHLLDSKTGMPIQNGLAGVSIFADDSSFADGLSTGLFSLGVKDGLALAQSLDGVEAMFITREGQISYTPGLEGTLTLLENAKE
jgi:thiamine biosynthesis lipoprotein